jgi:hypothetical protein
MTAPLPLNVNDNRYYVRCRGILPGFGLSRTDGGER